MVRRVRCCMIFAGVVSIAGVSLAASAGASGGVPQSTLSVKPVGGSYVVSPTGNDSGPGTQAAPWRTLARAARTLKPGDAVFIREGTYAERLVPQRSGEDGRHIIYAAFPGEQPVIDAADVPLPTWGGPVDIKEKQYIVISGLTVLNATEHRDSTSIFAFRSSHLVIEHNTTRRSGASGVGIWHCSHVLVDGNEISEAGVSDGQEALSIAVTTNYEVRNNHVHHCRREGIDCKDGSSFGKVHGNRIHDVTRQAIYVDGFSRPTEDIEIYNNVVRDCGLGFIISCERGGVTSNIRFYNNVIAGSTNFAGSVADYGSKDAPVKRLVDVFIINNTFHDNNNPFQLGNRDVTNVVVRNNIFSRKPVMLPQGRAAADQYHLDGNVYTDSGFIDAPGGDFRLTRSSPAIGKGVVKLAPELDINAFPRARDGRIDAGAYELGSMRPVPKTEPVAKKKDRTVPRPVAVRMRPCSGAVEQMDAMLAGRVRDELRAGGSVSMHVSSLRRSVPVKAIDEDATLTLDGRGLRLTMRWDRLSAADRASLAVSIARGGAAADQALAAFYFMLDGNMNAGRDRLARAGEFAEITASLFEPQTVNAAADGREN